MTAHEAFPHIYKSSTMLRTLKSAQGEDVSLKRVLVWLFLPLFFYSSRSFATFADITGTYIGNTSGTEANCVFSGIGPFPTSAFLQLTITSFDTNTGAFSGTGSDEDGTAITFNGIINSAGTVISSSLTATSPEPGVSTGDFNGSVFSSGATSWNINITAADVSGYGGDLCNPVLLSGTLSKTSADLVINPTVTNSATITNTQTLVIQVQGISSDVGGRIDNVLRGNAIGHNLDRYGFMVGGQADGLNAGDELMKGFGAWASFSHSEFENDLSSLAFDGDRNTFLFGIDLSPSPGLVVGLAAGYEFSDIDTKVNLGNIETDGFSVIPYFGYLINDTFSVSGSGGYSFIDADQFRTAAGTRITSDAQSDRYFGTVNLDGLWFRGNWIFGSNIGLLWANNEQEAFTESNGTLVAEQDTKLRQWSLGGNVAYTYGNFEPFISAVYSRDFVFTEILVTTGPQPSNDRDDILFGAGVRYYSDKGISGNLEYNKRLDRDDFDEDMINLSVRVEY